MKFSIKRAAAAVCMAAFLATSFLPGTGETANGRMSLAQAQQQVKKPLYQKYPHYKTKHPQKFSRDRRNKFFRHDTTMHRPAMHTRGPVSQTWVPVRNAPPHTLKSRSQAFKNTKPGLKPHAPMRPVSPAPYRQPGIRRYYQNLERP